MSGDVALPGSVSEPPHRLGGVRGNALAYGIHVPEIKLSIGVILLGGVSEPPRRLGEGPRNASAFVVHEPEIELSGGDALLSVKPESSEGRGIIASVICRHGFVEGLRCHRERAHHYQQQDRNHGEKSTCLLYRLHDSSMSSDSVN